jgi:hypothetical protein
MLTDDLRIKEVFATVQSDFDRLSEAVLRGTSFSVVIHLASGLSLAVVHLVNAARLADKK